MRASQSAKLHNQARDAWILISPLVLLMLIFILVPVLSNFYYSMTKWKGIGTPEFVGLSNFAKMFTDLRFFSALKTMGTLILYIPIGVFLPLIIAAVLRGGLKGWKIYRSILFLPNILGAVILGTLFSVLFSQVGPLIQLLSRLGVDDAARINLLGQSRSAIQILSLLFVVWLRLGFGCIYFLAAMAGIDGSYYDAARIDGAGWWQTFIRVTVPSVSFAIQFFTVLAFIEVFARMYSMIFTLTGGGPGYATYTLEFGVYRLGFVGFQRGYASAWAVVLFLVCAAIALVQIRLIRKSERQS
jgi:ABC-type sugar transport system permease subunit